MKKIVLLCFLFISGISFGQDYRYKFKIEGVIDLATAKEITDPLRNKFYCYPTFVDSIDTFLFYANVETTQDELYSYIAEYGYNLLFFQRVAILEEEKITE